MCTYNGCYTTFDETKRESLEVGKVADMVILSENPYEVGKERIKELKVEKLLLAGQEYQSCKGRIAKSILSGLTNRFNSF